VKVSSTIAGLAFVLFVVGCAQVAPPSPPAPPPSGQPQSISGTLPPGADTGKTSFYDFMQQVQWAPAKRVKMCTGSTSCVFGLAKTPVDLEPSAGSYLVDPAHMGPDTVLILRASNRGSDRTLHYHFRPGPYVYSFLVFRDTSHPDSASWILNETDTVTHVTVRVPDQTGRYFPCDHPAATSDYAGLYDCHNAPTLALVRTADIANLSAIDKLVSGAIYSFLFGESPIWKSCPAGCCTLLSLN
jgi:hypothetical protein